MRRLCGLVVTGAIALAALCGAPGSASATSLSYLGGEIMNNPHVYLTFWGSNWNQYPGARTEIREWFNRISGSAWQGILTQYYDQTGSVSGSVTSTSWTDQTISAPSEVNDVHVENEIEFAMSQQGWPGGGRENLYLVLPAPGSKFPYVEGCGSHHYSVAFNAPYAYVGWPGDASFESCKEGDPSGEKRAWVGAVLSVSHEYSEAVTDPETQKYAGQYTGWLDTSRPLGTGEIADLCEAQAAGLVNGAYVAQIWSNRAGGCRLQTDPPAATTTAATNVGWNQATGNGTVDPNGVPTTYYFQYGTTTSYGKRWSCRTGS